MIVVIFKLITVKKAFYYLNNTKQGFKYIINAKFYAGTKITKYVFRNNLIILIYG